jgi:hypothetical protein
LPFVVRAAYSTIAIGLGDQRYVLEPRAYVMRLAEDDWRQGIEVLDGMPEEMLLVGSMLMDDLYCIFDGWGARVGLARRLS